MNFQLSDIETYLEKENLKNTLLAAVYEGYKNKHEGESVSYFKFLQYIEDTKALLGNKRLYTEMVQFNNHAMSVKLMHKKRGEQYNCLLSTMLYQDNTDYMANSAEYDVNYPTCEHNDAINNILSRGGTIYMNSDAKICCRFSTESDVEVHSIKQVEMVISSYLSCPIKITKYTPNYVEIDIETMLRSKVIEGVVDAKDSECGVK